MAINTSKKYSSIDLQKWLFDKALSASPGHARRIIATNDQRSRDIPVVGKLYFMRYDPKYKDTLPIYDRFPLVIPIEFYQDSILGLNLHYLSFYERHALLDRLLEYRSNNKWDETMKIRMTYRLMSGAKKLDTLARPCIKKYLFTHVRSQFIEVLPTEYDVALQLPIAQWVQKRNN
jgi:hypothetical protein